MEEKQTKKKFHLNRTVKLMLVSALAAAVAVSAVFFAVNRSNSKAGQPTVTSTVVKEKILKLNELSSVKYMYTNVGKFSQTNDFNGYEIPFTKKSFLITYNGTIKAGMNMDDAKVSVSQSAVSVTLPQAKVLSHEIDEKSIEVYDETKNIFNPISVKDYTNFAAGEKVKMEKKAETEGLLKEAFEKAETSIKEMLKTTAGDRTVTVSQIPAESSASSAESSVSSDQN